MLSPLQCLCVGVSDVYTLCLDTCHAKPTAMSVCVGLRCLYSASIHVMLSPLRCLCVGVSDVYTLCLDTCHAKPTAMGCVWGVGVSDVYALCHYSCHAETKNATGRGSGETKMLVERMLGRSTHPSPPVCCLIRTRIPLVRS